MCVTNGECNEAFNGEHVIYSSNSSKASKVMKNTKVLLGIAKWHVQKPWTWTLKAKIVKLLATRSLRFQSQRVRDPENRPQNLNLRVKTWDLATLKGTFFTLVISRGLGKSFACILLVCRLVALFYISVTRSHCRSWRHWTGSVAGVRVGFHTASSPQGIMGYCSKNLPSLGLACLPPTQTTWWATH